MNMMEVLHQSRLDLHCIHRRVIERRNLSCLGPESCLEVQFRSWILDWNTRVFKNRMSSPGKLSCYFTPEQYHLIKDMLVKYHRKHPEQVGQDRFIWLSFGGALIEEHKKHKSSHPKSKRFNSRVHQPCVLNKTMYILLWIGFYLKMDSTPLISQLLLEIVSCTGNFRFLFSFLPGMSIKLFMQLLWNNAANFEDELCQEYFSLISCDRNILSFQSRDLYDFSVPFVKFLINRLKPFHQESSEKAKSPLTLHQVLNSPILPAKKFSLLTLAVHFSDAELVSTLLRLGACPQFLYWDELTESMLCAERMMVTLINTFMVSRRFLAMAASDGKNISDAMLDKIRMYAPIIRRAVLHSQVRKSNGFWSGRERADCCYELHSDVADDWGVDYKPPFPSLQHICKVTVREHILRMDREVLPAALETLPLPRKVVAYLDLQMD